MNPEGIRRKLPQFLERYLWFFEYAIENKVIEFSAALPAGARVLDAGAGEGRYRRHFPMARYVGIDLAIGDGSWDYSGLDLVGDLAALPLRDGVFDAALHIVTLEHVRDPQQVLSEIGRTLRPGGRLLLVAPQDWEVHQAPHDYFRYTRYGIRHLLETAGFTSIVVEAEGGYFRLMGRRMLNGFQFFRGPWLIPAALVLGPAGLLFPLFDGLDRKRDFTLGYLCTAIKS